MDEGSVGGSVGRLGGVGMNCLGWNALLIRQLLSLVWANNSRIENLRGLES